MIARAGECDRADKTKQQDGHTYCIRAGATLKIPPNVSLKQFQFINEGLSTNPIGIPQVCWYCTYDWQESLGNFAILSLLHAT